MGIVIGPPREKKIRCKRCGRLFFEPMPHTCLGTFIRRIGRVGRAQFGGSMFEKPS